MNDDLNACFENLQAQNKLWKVYVFVYQYRCKSYKEKVKQKKLCGAPSIEVDETYLEHPLTNDLIKILVAS